MYSQFKGHYCHFVLSCFFLFFFFFVFKEYSVILAAAFLTDLSTDTHKIASKFAVKSDFMLCMHNGL